MFVFKDKKNSEFIKVCIEELFTKISIKYKIVYIPNDVNTKLRLTSLILYNNQTSIFKSQYLKSFRNNLLNKFTIENTWCRQRKQLYFLALCFGYIWFTKLIGQCDRFGYRYSDVLDYYRKSNEPKIYTYKFLKSKRIHNLKYYTLYKDSKNELDRLYIVNEEVGHYKYGVTVDCKNITFIKLY